MIFRVYWLNHEGFVHCRLFAGDKGKELTKCGDLMFKAVQFRFFKKLAGTYTWGSIEFLNEPSAVGTALNKEPRKEKEK